MRYGTPYKGSKNTIAEWVVRQLPPARHFVDLFAGGCAVTHAAMLSGKYRDFIANDIGDAPGLFRDAALGKFRDESRWIGREDFFRLKDSEPYVRYCWSFGNNGRNYLHSMEIEPYKRAVFEWVMGRGDGGLLRLGIPAPAFSGGSVRERYLAWKSHWRDVVRGGGNITAARAARAGRAATAARAARAGRAATAARAARAGRAATAARAARAARAATAGNIKDVI